ncbi:MAG: hypothetical protein WBH85_11730 [Thermoanaerobaculia bacterium]
MIGSKKLLCFGLLFVLAAAAGAQEEATPRTPDGFDTEPPPKRSRKEPLTRRMYIGGWLGASFGSNMDYVEAAPELGFRVSPKVQLGGSLVYRYRKDKRFDPDLSTTDLGGALFGRYFVYAPLYLQAGVEQLSWEYVAQVPEGLTTVDADHTAVLVGPGVALPLGPRAATYMSILYDLNYDSNGPNPYERPWVFRIGFGVGL